MQAFVFYLRRFFYFIGDLVVQPVRFARDLWQDSARGRLLLLGIPSVLVFAAAVVLALVASGSHDQRLLEYSEARDAAEKAGRIPEAITYTYKLMQLQPNQQENRFKLVQLLLRDTSEARNESNRGLAETMLLAMAPTDRVGYPEAHVERALIVARAPNIPRDRRDKLMEVQLSLALQGDPENVRARELTANLLIRKQDPEAALAIFRKLFEEDAKYYKHVVTILQQLHRSEESKPVIRKAIEHYEIERLTHPDNVQNVLRLGEAWANLGEFDTAITLLAEEAEKTHDAVKRRQVTEFLAEIHIAQSRNRKASANFNDDPNERRAYLDDLAAAYRLNPGNETAMTAITEFSLHNFPESAEARQVYDARTDVDNAPDGALFQIGTWEILNGDEALGISLLESGLQRNPRNHIILNNLAYSLIDKDPKRALEFADRAIGIAPGVWNYFDTRGNIQLKLGEFAKATFDLEKAVLGVDQARQNSTQAQSRELDRKKASLFRKLEAAFEGQGLPDDAASYRDRAKELEASIQ